jgi:pyruvoyl-dependent arginine decarboxylase (PvlArgDC)
MPIAQDMKNITEEIEVSYGERMSWLADVMKDTHQMMSRIHKENAEAADAVPKLLAHFRGDHKAMAEALGAFLDKSESTRLSEFKEMLSSIQSRQREREEEVAEIMDRFAKEIKEMASQLKEFLSESESQRLSEFKAFFPDVQKRTREILTATQEDLKEARTHWQNLAKIMASKRTGKRVPITEVPKEAEVPKRVEEAAEEAFSEGELKVRALTLIKESPEGISLRQLGSKLEVSYIRLARPIKELLDEGKVIKKDSLYFPASVEV